MSARPNRSTSTARERMAQARAAEQRKRRQRIQIGVVAGVLALVLIGVGIAVFVSQNQPTPTPTSSAEAPVNDAELLGELTSIPAETFTAAGAPATAATNIFAIPNGTPRVTEGLPTVTYVGGEYCPYCAGERWALVASLSRFGTFSGLATSTSADNEGDIPTVTFASATYTSDVLGFDAYELADRDGQPLQTLPDDLTSLMKQWDAPPYSNTTGGIPWTWLGTYQTVGSAVPINDFFVNGGTTNDQGKTVSNVTHAQVVEAMTSGSAGLGQDILAASNVISAQICTLTDNQPTDVCSDPAVIAAAAQLPKA